METRKTNDYRAITDPFPFGTKAASNENSNEGSTQGGHSNTSISSNTKKKGVRSNTGVQKKMGMRKKKSVSGNTSVLSPKTYKLPLELVNKVNCVAYWQRRNVQDVVAEALRTFLEGVPDDDKAEIPNR